MIIITVARKPYPTSATACVLDNGCGGLNINDTRIGFTSEKDKWKPSHAERLVHKAYLIGKEQKHEGERLDGQEYAPTVLDSKPNDNGRWPANLILNPMSQQKLDAQSGIQKSGVAGQNSRAWGAGGDVVLSSSDDGVGWKANGTEGYDDVGGASRYFKVFK